MGFEKALGAVKVIKDQIQYRSQSLLNLARRYFRSSKDSCKICIFRETRKTISQLSLEHSISHLEFMSVVAVVVQLCSSYFSRFGGHQEKKKIHFDWFLTRTERAE